MTNIKKEIIENKKETKGKLEDNTNKIITEIIINIITKAMIILNIKKPTNINLENKIKMLKIKPIITHKEVRKIRSMI